MSSETSANSNKLKAKDFITVGIFTAIIFVVEFACGMLGYIHPFIVASYVIMVPLVGSIPMMLFYTKVQKFGMITIIKRAGSIHETAQPAIFLRTEGIRISAISQIRIR